MIELSDLGLALGSGLLQNEVSIGLALLEVFNLGPAVVCILLSKRLSLSFLLLQFLNFSFVPVIGFLLALLGFRLLMLEVLNFCPVLFCGLLLEILHFGFAVLELVDLSLVLHSTFGSLGFHPSHLALQSFRLGNRDHRKLSNWRICASDCLWGTSQVKRLVLCGQIEDVVGNTRLAVAILDRFGRRPDVIHRQVSTYTDTRLLASV